MKEEETKIASMNILFLGLTGARYYDSEFATFLSVDPLAAEMTSWSPYSYVFANPLKFIDPDGRKPVFTEPPTTHIVFLQFEGRLSLGVTGSAAAGVFIEVKAGEVASIGAYVTTTIGGGLVAGGSIGFSAGMAFTTIDQFNGKGFSIGAVAEIGMSGFSGEINAYPEDIKEVFSGDQRSFYETFIKDSNFGGTTSVNNGGVGAQIGSYFDVGFTNILAGLGLNEALDKQIGFLRENGYDMNDEEESNYRKYVSNIYDSLKANSNETNCNDEEVCNN